MVVVVVAKAARVNSTAYQKWRLAAVQIVDARAIRDKADGVHHVNKIVNHPTHSVPHPANKQSLDSPVGVPVVRFPEASPGNNKGLGKGDGRETLGTANGVVKFAI